MDHNRQEANCCGGPLRTAFVGDALTVAQWRIDEAWNAKAGILTTFCPQCVISLRQGVAMREFQIEVKDLPELMTQALGVEADL